MIVVVHGATGAQGVPVVDRLLAAGHTVRAVTRGRRSSRPDRLPPGVHSLNVEAVNADLTDVDDLVKAYDGADAAVLVLPGGAAPDQAVAQADTILTALTRARVPRAVFNASGAIWTRPPGVAFLDARTHLASGLPNAVQHATLIGPATAYMENFSEPWLVRHLHDTGNLIQTAPADASQMPVAMADIADAATTTLTRDTPPARVVVAGPTTTTGSQIATAIARHLGRPVRWTTVSPQTYLRGVAEGLGVQYAANIGALYGPDAQVPPPDAPPAGTLHLRGPTDLTRWIPTQNWTPTS